MHTNRYTNNNNTSNTMQRDSGSSSSASNYSFYNLQMYSNTGNTSSVSTQSAQSTPFTQSTHTQQNTPFTQTAAHTNLYQNIQEVPYHHHAVEPLDRRPPSPAISPRSSPNPPTISTPINTVHKNGITFIDPFQAQTQVNAQQQQQSLRQLAPLYATFGPDPIFVTCPYCHHTAETEVQQAVGSEALLWACLIPFAGLLLKSKWDTRHKCKNCLNVIGIHYPQ